MAFKLQIFFIVMSLLTLAFFITRIRKHKLNIDDAVIWIVWGLFLLVLSIFPNLAISAGEFFGFISTSNFILCMFVFFLYIINFAQMTKISALKEKQKELIQKLSLLTYQRRKDEEERIDKLKDIEDRINKKQ